MTLKRPEDYKGFPTRDIYHDIIGFRADKGLDEQENEVWKVTVKIVMYSDANKVEALDPPKEYLLGSVSNPSVITYDKVIELTMAHENFIGATEV